MTQQSEAVESTETNPGYWALIAAGEPYRVLFPIGLILGILGISLWPAYVWNLINFYPSQIHARIMIEGFLSCFVIGFLGTAFPRLLEVRRFSLEESLSWSVAIVGASMFHLFGKALWGDYLFTLSLILLIGSLLVRFRTRKDTPPPGFVLVILGLLCALFGGAAQVVLQLWPDFLSSNSASFFRLILNQGYLLLPVMGIGAFLIPRFFGLPNKQDFPESRSLPTGWIPRALFALTCGCLVLISFYLESIGYLRAGYGLRAFSIVLYFFRELPIHQAKFNQGSLALAMRIALASIPLGYLLMAIWPSQQAAFIHVVFISGFSLLTLTVASRVILGHSGRSQLFKFPMKSIYVMTGLLCFAMLTRVSADWMPNIRMSHLGYAAIVWLIGVIVWAVKFMPYLKSDLDRQTQ